jgi:hypothetical protein
MPQLSDAERRRSWLAAIIKVLYLARLFGFAGFEEVE